MKRQQDLGNTKEAETLNAKLTQINSELQSLVIIIKQDQEEVFMMGGTKAGLIIGLVLSLGAVVIALLYVKKMRKSQLSEFDEGGEQEDDYRQMP